MFLIISDSESKIREFEPVFLYNLLLRDKEQRKIWLAGCIYLQGVRLHLYIHA